MTIWGGGWIWARSWCSEMAQGISWRRNFHTKIMDFNFWMQNCRISTLLQFQFQIKLVMSFVFLFPGSHFYCMELGNDTEISEFLLLGFSQEPELQPLIFGLFLSMYLITVFGNLLIMLAVSSDAHLHTPMYFFLSNLSFVDICFTSTTIPKMLWNIQRAKVSPMKAASPRCIFTCCLQD